MPLFVVSENENESENAQKILKNQKYQKIINLPEDIVTKLIKRSKHNHRPLTHGKGKEALCYCLIPDLNDVHEICIIRNIRELIQKNQIHHK